VAPDRSEENVSWEGSITQDYIYKLQQEDKRSQMRRTNHTHKKSLQAGHITEYRAMPAMTPRPGVTRQDKELDPSGRIDTAFEKEER
jgi:hypothetical protein